jgi:hypothetical protein
MTSERWSVLSYDGRKDTHDETPSILGIRHITAIAGDPDAVERERGFGDASPSDASIASRISLSVRSS